MKTLRFDYVKENNTLFVMRDAVYPSLKKRLSLNIYHNFVKTQIRLHDLSYFFWECTLRCNISCLHCGSDCRRDHQMKDMPYPDFLKVTEQVKSFYNPNKVMIVITGGEPLVRKDLEKCGIELYKQGFPWGFVTNGYALTKERFRKLMDSGLRSVTVSIDGFEASHDWLRGVSGSYKKALGAIGMIVNENELVYDVVTCVNQKNFGELGRLKEFLVKAGVKKWRLFTIFPSGRAKDNPLLDIGDNQFVALMEFIKATRKENKIQTSYGCEGFLGNYEGEVRDGLFFCRAGINIASVLADGSICACPNINHSFVQGNIYKDNFMDVWNNRFEVMRDRQWTKTNECATCKVYKWCLGNGIHLHNDKEGQVMRCHFGMLEKGV